MRSVLFLFAALNDTDIGWMARAGEVRRFAPGDVLIAQGAKPLGLFIVLQGLVQVQVHGGAEVALRRPGECLGEVSLVDSRPASTDVIAVEPTVALLLGHAVLRARLEQDTGFAARCYRAIAILLANRLREATSGSDALDLDEIMLDGMARAGERFRLLGEYLAERVR